MPGALEVCCPENTMDEGKTLLAVELGGPVEKLRQVLMAGRKRGEESPWEAGPRNQRGQGGVPMD